MSGDPRIDEPHLLARLSRIERQVEKLDESVDSLRTLVARASGALAFVIAASGTVVGVLSFLF